MRKQYRRLKRWLWQSLCMYFGYRVVAHIGKYPIVHYSFTWSDAQEWLACYGCGPVSLEFWTGNRHVTLLEVWQGPGRGTT